MKITPTRNNTHIEDSYEIKLAKSMKNIVEEIIFTREARMLPVTRSVNSYVREWKGHNRLYRLGLFRKHTKDCDLNENNSIFEELLWFILGI